MSNSRPALAMSIVACVLALLIISAGREHSPPPGPLSDGRAALPQTAVDAAPKAQPEKKITRGRNLPEIDPEIDRAIKRYARHQGIEPWLIKGLIMAESSFDPRAVSPRGACGLMQLMPSTARKLGVTDIFDPIQNIKAGIEYLKECLDIFDNDRHLAIAAYRCGPDRVRQAYGIPDNSQTSSFVRVVLNYGHQFKSRKKPSPDAAS